MIEINGIEPRDEKRQIGYITIEIDGNNYEFSVGNIPIELTTNSAILAHLELRKDEITLLVLKKLYPQSDHLRFQKDGMTEIESMQEWISKGHKNKIQIGLTTAGNPKYDYALIEKRELQYKHPKSVRLLALIEASNVAKEIKDLLTEIVK